MVDRPAAVNGALYMADHKIDPLLERSTSLAVHLTLFFMLFPWLILNLLSFSWDIVAVKQDGCERDNTLHLVTRRALRCYLAPSFRRQTTTV